MNKRTYVVAFEIETINRTQFKFEAIFVAALFRVPFHNHAHKCTQPKMM